MILPNEPYGTARGVEIAIKNAARAAAAADPSLDTNKRIQLEYFNRFLSRIFSEGDESEWVLKGGTSILARVPSTRSTKDIDLYREEFGVERALEDLRRLATIDLGDHFRFEYVGHETSIGADRQPYTDGYRVTFNIFIGVANKGSLHIDLAVGAGMTDLVVFAVTQDMNGDALSFALETERRRRRMEPLSAFVVPSIWGAGYVKLSRAVPHCSDYRTVAVAADLVSQLIDPALTGQASGRNWAHKELRWV